MKTNEEEMKSPLFLQPEIIEEIVSRLPVKSILRFRCVSKSWLSLIDSDRFIKIHFQKSTKNPTLAHHSVVFNVGRDGITGCSLPSLLNWSSESKEGGSSSSSSSSAAAASSSSSESVSVAVDPTSPLPKTGLIVGCCKGLSCLSNLKDFSLSLWNPATRVSVDLPKLEHIFPKFGFGRDESSGAFKVFAASKRKSHELLLISGHIYSSKTNSWKRVAFGSEYWFSPFGVHVGGSIHWAIGECGGGHFIESFDLGREEFGRIELPSCDTIANVDVDADDATESGWPRTWLGEIGGCLCALFDNKKAVDVWIMKEYGVIDSWFKLLITIPFSVPQPHLIGGGLNGEIFVMYRDTLMVYSPKDEVSSTATTTINCYRACMYVESLVSPRTNTMRSRKTRCLAL